MSDPEPCRIKHTEDTEEQRDLMELKEESEELSEVKEESEELSEVKEESEELSEVKEESEELSEELSEVKGKHHADGVGFKHQLASNNGVGTVGIGRDTIYVEEITTIHKGLE
ncbi:unnamed protein product [Leuciscus chuanchicus]